MVTVIVVSNAVRLSDLELRVLLTLTTILEVITSLLFLPSLDLELINGSIKSHD